MFKLIATLNTSQQQWRRWAPALAVLLVLTATVMIYLPGLHGPFLLDDPGNLEPLSRWFHGELGWRGVILDNRSGPSGRPFSMLTFLLDAERTGNLDSFTFKPTNLVIHLLTGVSVILLVKEIVRVGHWTLRWQYWLPVVVMTFWLWLPIQVSTVLYVIQRMAQLSALWTVVTLAAYLSARRRITDASSLMNYALLWIGVPLFAVLATLSKENGALALPLAAVAEWTLFAESTRPRSIKLFFTATVGVPTLVAVAYIAAHPNYFSQGYAARDFTLGERLLTEPRILWNYVATSFVPTGSNMGIYHDNYVVSQGLFSPWTTCASIAAWIGMLAWAIAWRRIQPAFSFGVLAYLTAHLLESGPIALELYFEHRNYLPSAFAIVALCGLARQVTAGHHFTPVLRRAGVTAIVAIAAVYGLSSWNHAAAWSSEEEFHALQYDYNPTSPRLLSVLAGHAIIDRDLAKSLRYIREGEIYSAPSELGTSTLWRFIAYCEASTPVPTELYDELASRNRGRITNFAMVGWELLGDRVQRGCVGLDTSRLVREGMAWLDNKEQARTTQTVWRTRYNLGRIEASTGDIRAAEAMIHRAWLDSNHNNGIGVMLFQLNASLGNVDTCKEVLAYLKRAAGGDDKNLNAAVASFTDAIDQGKIGANH